MPELEIFYDEGEHYYSVDPCPFCGKDLGRFGWSPGVVGLTHIVWVECQNHNCQAQGPKMKSFREATDAWNERE